MMAAVSSKRTSKKSSADALKMLAKYPERRPVICIKAPDLSSGPLADLPERKKFLVPIDMDCDAFKDVVRKHISETVNVSIPAESISLIVVGSVLKAVTMRDAYDQYKADDCFLYISFSVDSSDCMTNGGQSPSHALGMLPDGRRPSKGEVDREAKKLLLRHPKIIPVICKKASGSSAPEPPKSKFLVPRTMLCSEFRRYMLNCLQMPQDESSDATASISLCVANNMLDGATTMNDTYEQHKSLDGFLHVSYTLDEAAAASAPVAATEEVQEEVLVCKSGYQQEESLATAEDAQTATLQLSDPRTMCCTEFGGPLGSPAEDARGALSNVSAELLELREALEQKDFVAMELAKQLEEAMTKVQQLQSKVEQLLPLQGDVSALKLALEDKEELLTEQTQLAEAAAARLREVSDEFDRMRAACAEELEHTRLQGQAATDKASADRARAELEQLERMRLEGESAAEKARCEGTCLAADVARLQENLEQKDTLVQEKSNELEAARTQVQELQSQVQSLKSATEQGSRLVSEKSLQVESLSVQQHALNAELGTMKANHAESLEQTRLEGVAIAEKARKDASRATAELLQVQKERAQLETKLEAMQHAQMIKDGMPKYAASVHMFEDELTLGIEAEEDISARGDVTKELAEVVSICGAQQAFRIGRMRLPVTHRESAPVYAKVAIKNEGACKWPNSIAIVNLEGDSWGFQVHELAALGPGEVTEIMMDLEVNSQSEAAANMQKHPYTPPRHAMPKLAPRVSLGRARSRSEARSLWAIVDAATGARLGPLIVFEVLWDLP